MEIVKMKLVELNPAKYNPRKALEPGDAAYEKLKKSILSFGNVEPIVWNRTSGNVIGGHQRLRSFHSATDKQNERNMKAKTTTKQTLVANI